MTTAIIRLNQLPVNLQSPEIFKEAFKHHDTKNSWTVQFAEPRYTTILAGFIALGDAMRLTVYGVEDWWKQGRLTQIGTDCLAIAKNFIILATTAIVLGLLSPKAVSWTQSKLGLVAPLPTFLEICSTHIRLTALKSYHFACQNFKLLIPGITTFISIFTVVRVMNLQPQEKEDLKKYWSEFQTQFSAFSHHFDFIIDPLQKIVEPLWSSFSDTTKSAISVAAVVAGYVTLINVFSPK